MTSDGVIYSEHAPGDIERFRSAGWRAEKADKSLDEGIAEVRRRVELDDDDRPGLLVAERCEHFVREIMSYKEEHVGRSGATDHALDATRYAAHTDALGGADDDEEAFIITK